MRRQLAALVLALSLPWPAQAAQVVVRPGETLSEIAARAGISTQRLMQINGLRDADHIVAGQRLTVPTAAPSGSGGSRGRGQVPGRITIRQGETLSEIAQRYGVSVERLMQLNGLTDPSRVVAGDALVLRAPTSPRRSGGGGAGGTSVVVRPGETLSEIADRHNVSVERLVQLNGIQNPSQLMAGDRIVISSRPPARTSTSGGARIYVVQPGDTLSEIASETRVPMQRLLSLNNLQDPDDLSVGTRLKLTTPPPVPRSRPRTSTRPRPRVTTPAVTTPSVARTPATPTRSTAATTAPTSRGGSSATATANSTSPSTIGARTTTSPTPQSKTTTPTGAGASTTTSPAIATTGTTTPAATTATTSTATSTTTPTRTPISSATPTRTATSAATSATPTSTATTAPTTTATTAGSTVATANSRPAGAGTSPRTTAPRTGRRPGVVTPDWRTYGPLQVDWASWQSMGGSYVAPVLGSSGQPYYLAINCGARKLNTTAASGQWKTWESPSSDAEESLVNDLCKLKGG